ncbi:MAG TPA: hypothetical protein VGD95_07520 [Micavibrio sp.]
MAPDRATQARAEHPFYRFFHTVAPILTQTIPEEGFVDPDQLIHRFHALQDVYEADMARMAEVTDLLFGSDIVAYGPRCTAVFDRWERGCGHKAGCPTLTAMIAQAVQHFNLDPDDKAVRAAFIGAVLGEIPNDLEYHGNDHYRKVLFHTIRLLSLHNQQAAPDDRLDDEQIALTLAAACIHDLGHPGGDNAKEGVYAPGLMEQKSFDQARPYLEAAGLNPEQIGQMETLVFCTDITFFAGDNSPCVRMKKIYKHYFWDDQSEDVSMMMMGKLRRYEGNPKLALMAMLLHEADIGTSAGLSYERTITETVSFLRERNITLAGPKTVLAFLRDQLGETMFTNAGKQLFGQAMAQVIEQAEQDILAGKERFTDEPLFSV